MNEMFTVFGNIYFLKINESERLTSAYLTKTVTSYCLFEFKFIQ